MLPRYAPGPTYDEMRDPGLLPEALRFSAQRALTQSELSPLNLFNIHWRRTDSREVRHFVVPRALTGVACNIIMLVGRDFPSGSHKVGPAYSTLAEMEVEGQVTHDNTIVGPSTGNFGIGTAYVSRLKGYKALVVMPDSMSQERYDRIKKYGGELDLTPGTESDVILTLERTHKIKNENPDLRVLAQFELMPNYRFHRHVTGAAVLEAAAEHGNGQVAAFISAPGSAGTLAAGDAAKAAFPDAVVVALEPRECSTLYDGGRGQHRIEGIGDKMVTLIHNLLTTDQVALIHDDASVKGVYLMQHARHLMADRLGIEPNILETMADSLGISGLCNLLGAIKTAKLLGLGEQDNVVTIATDGFDRYPTVMLDLERRMGGSVSESMMADWIGEVFHEVDSNEMLDVSGAKQKRRLHQMKAELWTQFGYTTDYLDAMMEKDFWESEYHKVHEYNERIKENRASNGGLPISGTSASWPAVKY